LPGIVLPAIVHLGPLGRNWFTVKPFQRRGTEAFTLR
jgi:hypothetical protein